MEKADSHYLYFDELRAAICTGRVDYSLVERRREDYRRYAALTPPRIIISNGEVPTASIEGERVPEGALMGVPVSAGTVEGRARVVSRVEEARVQRGDILVTEFTDPSWTPLFVTVEGLVTEVGGFTTHGAVVAREYGLPAVVGVQHATELIKDGQLIRVNGSEGYVELL